MASLAGKTARNHCSKEAIDELCAWFDSVGGYLPSVSVSPMPRGEGWRIIAPREGGIQTGDILLSIPLQWCLDSGRASLPTSDSAAQQDSAASSPAWPLDILNQLESWDDTDVLALRLVAERRAGSNSPWAPWIRSLPNSFDMPIFWKAEERALLDGTNIGALSNLMERRLEKDW